MTLSSAVIFENFQHFTCFSIFFYLKQFNRNKLWYPPKCVPFALFNYPSLSYVILALLSAVTNLPNKTLIFHDFQGPTIKFHNFPSLKNEIFKFHDSYELCGTDKIYICIAFCVWDTNLRGEKETRVRWVSLKGVDQMLTLSSL